MSMIENNTDHKVKRGMQSESVRLKKEGRLNDLPDPLLIHILSFANARDAARTCILSRRWKDLWKNLHNLVIRSSDFRSVSAFTKFVPEVLSLRHGSLALQALDFQQSSGITHPTLLRRVIDYALSHSVERLGIRVYCDTGHLPGSVFSCQTLTSLKLSVLFPSRSTLFPELLSLPALTSLYLQYFSFCASGDDRAEPFSGCKRLKDLVIQHCTVWGARILCISSATLSSVSIIPRSSDFYEIVLSTPNLRSFSFEGVPFQHLSGSNLSHVEQVYIDADILSEYSKAPSILLDWLTGLTNVKSLTVSTNTLQVLLMNPGLLKIKLPSLGNLKSLKVKLKRLSLVLLMIVEASLSTDYKRYSIVPDGIVAFLLQNSSSAKVSVVKL